MSANWKLDGTYFEACNCDAACPCYFLSTPTQGECTVLVAWHISEGQFDGVSLDGLNVALAVHAPGHMMEVKWIAALYLDQAASTSQAEALTQIFAGQAGGHPAKLGSHIGEVLGVKNVAIDYKANGKRRSISIARIAEVEIEAMEGQGGEDITINNHPLCIAPGNAGVVAKSKKMEFKDHGLQWSISDKNGLYSAFAYQGD